MGSNAAKIIKAEAEDNPHPLTRPNIRSTVGRALEKAYNRLSFEVEDWIEEVRATAQAAAISGDFDASFKFYELTGKAIGAVQDPKNAQHLHMHGPINQNTVTEMSTEEINERRTQLIAQKNREEAKETAARQLENIMK